VPSRLRSRSTILQLTDEADKPLLTRRRAQLVEFGEHLALILIADMRVRLTRKLADSLDGVDLSFAHVGDTLDLIRHEAELLIVEGWAEGMTERPSASLSEGTRRRFGPFVSVRANAADAIRRAPRSNEWLRENRKKMEGRSLRAQQHRRAEDRFREEHHGSRAKTISKD
jgi:hypothetical protein